MKTEQVILCLGMIISLWIISMIAKPLDKQQETMIISTEMILPSNQMELIIEETGKKHPKARNKFPQAKGNKKNFRIIIQREARKRLLYLDRFNVLITSLIPSLAFQKRTSWFFQ